MKILDQYGKPIDTATLREPQSARVAPLVHRLTESHLDGLTPARAARILKDADAGNLLALHQLFDDMEDRDAHLRGEFDKRRSAPLALDWRIEPPTNATATEKRAAAMVEALLRDTVDDLEDVLLAMMDAVGHGFAAVEIAWEQWGREWLPNFHPRPQTWFRTDPSGRELRLEDGSGEGAQLNPLGWILHQSNKPKTGYLGRMGLARVLVWPFLYKAYSIGDFAEFLQTYGLPIIIGKYMEGTDDAGKASLLRAVTQLGRDARAIMPESMTLEIAKITAGGDGAHHLAMAAWADAAQSKAILGQVLSAEARSTGLGSGVADLHAEVRRDILLSDVRQLAGTLGRDLVYPLLALNGGGIDSYRRCPRWVFDLGESEDIVRYADALPKLVGVGFRIPREWAHEKLRIPEPDGNEDVLAKARPEMVAPPAVRAAPAAAAAARWRPAMLAALAGAGVVEPDPADQLAPRLAAQTQPVVDAWLADIEAVLAANPELTPAALQERLLQLFGDLPTDELVEVMALAHALAELVGMDDVRSEDA